MEELTQLIEDCKLGKRNAQARLYQQYAPVLFGICLRYSRDQTEAEDTLHEGFITILNKIGQYAYKGSFEGWLKRIMINTSLEKFRNRYRLQIVEDISKYDIEPSENDVYSDLNTETLLKLVSELPPRYRMVFNMYAIDGYSHNEISEQLGIAIGTSKSNLARARKILQERIIEMGFLEKIYAKEQ
ncbi:MAG: sigma-70 family RNA polymerase sigma factor [Prolixibacteraceae bacterium]|nr:sigma-70 family RNA polymerase sigma factor [Prolixibacteraceae bacterium]